MKKIISLFLCVVIFSVANITATADENIITGNLNDTVTYKYNISSCVLTFSGKGDLTLYSPRSTEDKIITKGNIGSDITYYINEMCLNAKTLILEKDINKIHTYDIFYLFNDLEKAYFYNKDFNFNGYDMFQHDVKFCGYMNSTAYKYAKNHNLTFYDIKTNKEYQLVNGNKKWIDMLPKDIGVYEPVDVNGRTYKIATGKVLGYEGMIYHEPNTNRKEYREILKATQDVIKNCKTDLDKAKAIYDYVAFKKYEREMHFVGNQIESVYNSFKYAAGCEPRTLLTRYMLYLANIPSVQAKSVYHTWCLALVDNKWVTVDTAMLYFGEEYTNIIPTEYHHITEICFNHKNMIFVIDEYAKGIALTGLGRYFSDDEAGYGYDDYKTLINKHKNITLPKWATEDDYIIYAAKQVGYKGKIKMPNGKVINCKNVISWEKIFHVCQPTNKRVSAKATHFNNGYKNAIVCKKCKKVIKGKTIKKLKLKTPLFSVKASKKMLKVKYTKVTDATGFQVKYTIGKKTVTKTFSTKKSATKTIKGLKKGKYKVQVRAFVKNGSKKAYSKWSKTKIVKVK